MLFESFLSFYICAEGGQTLLLELVDELLATHDVNLSFFLCIYALLQLHGFA